MNIDILTVDKSQGIDKDCIIINLGITNSGADCLLNVN